MPLTPARTLPLLRQQVGAQERAERQGPLLAPPHCLRWPPGAALRRCLAPPPPLPQSPPPALRAPAPGSPANPAPPAPRTAPRLPARSAPLPLPGAMGAPPGYRPSAWVHLLHQLPRADFQLRPVPSGFAPRDQEYQQVGWQTWARSPGNRRLGQTEFRCLRGWGPRPAFASTSLRLEFIP